MANKLVKQKQKNLVNKPKNVVIVLLSGNVTIVNFQKEIKEERKSEMSAQNQKVKVDQRQALASENLSRFQSDWFD